MGVPRRFPQPWYHLDLAGREAERKARWVQSAVRRDGPFIHRFRKFGPENWGWRSDEAEEPFIRQPLHPFSREWRCAHNREHSGFYSVAPDSPEGGIVNMMENV